MDQTAIRAITAIGKAPRPHPSDRRCPCGTKLSRYNKGPTCYGCRGVTFPRVRGKITRGD